MWINITQIFHYFLMLNFNIILTSLKVCEYQLHESLNQVTTHQLLLVTYQLFINDTCILRDLRWIAI